MVDSKRMTKPQIIAKHNELVEYLQAEARMLFYDRMMYDVNDSLTSILAICDMEAKKSIPKIKNYIDRINHSLKNTKDYQNSFCMEKKFNISLVLDNLTRVIKDKYKHVKLTCLISDIKAPVQGDQSKFERLFLHIFVSMLLQSSTDDAEVLIELKQKDQDAMITMSKENFILSKEVLEQVDKIKQEEDFKGKIQIIPREKGAEVLIKVPLQFRVVSIREPVLKEVSPKQVSSKKTQASKRKVFGWGQARKGIMTPGIAF